MFSADEIVDKTLFVKINKSVNIYKLPSMSSNVLYTINGGGIVGVVYSFVLRQDGLWWYIDRNTQKLWVKHKEGIFDIKALGAQGALTTEELIKRKEEAEKSLSEKLFDKLIKVVKPAILIITAAYLFNFVIKK